MGNLVLMTRDRLNPNPTPAKSDASPLGRLPKKKPKAAVRTTGTNEPYAREIINREATKARSRRFETCAAFADSV